MAKSGLRRLFVLMAGLAPVCATTTPAHAATCSGVEFPDRVSVDGTDLVLNGLGIREATFLDVHVYVAGLYLPRKSGDAEEILAGGQDWRLALHFLRDVDAQEMHKAIQEGFERSGADLASLESSIDALKGMLVDFKEGQTASFTNEPPDGVEFAVDGDARGTVKNEKFADALLAIWLGPDAANADLKSGLLGGACD